MDPVCYLYRAQVRDLEPFSLAGLSLSQKRVWFSGCSDISLASNRTESSSVVNLGLSPKFLSCRARGIVRRLSSERERRHNFSEGNIFSCFFFLARREENASATILSLLLGRLEPVWVLLFEFGKPPEGLTFLHWWSGPKWPQLGVQATEWHDQVLHPVPFTRSLRTKQDRWVYPLFHYRVPMSLPYHKKHPNLDIFFSSMVTP